MRAETTFVIDYFQPHTEFIEAIEALPKTEKIHFMEKNLDLDEDIDLMRVQYNLLYAAVSNIEWDIVIKEMEQNRNESL